MEFTHMMHLLRAAASGTGPARPNLRTYNAAISALCRVGHLSRALRLEHEMVSLMKVLCTLLVSLGSVWCMIPIEAVAPVGFVNVCMTLCTFGDLI